MAEDHRRSTGKQILVEAFAVVVSLAVAFGLSSLVIGLQVNDTKVAATTAVQDAQDNDLAQLTSSLSALRSNLSALAAYSKTPTWLALRALPKAGTGISQATAVVQAASEVANASEGFDVLIDSLDSRNGTGQLVPVDTLRALGPASAELAASIGQLDSAIAAMNPQDFPGSIRSQIELAQSRGNQLLPQLQRLAAATPAVADLFGASGPQQWFVAFQNGGESRGTGGFVGSYAIMNMANGRLIPQEVGANEMLTAKANPDLVPADTRQLWGAERLAEIYGVNLSPNYPYAGSLLASMWQKQSGAATDVVLAIDQQVTVQLVAATGPVTVEGTTIDASNALYWLTVGVYQKYGPQGKDEFVNKLVGELMRRVSDGKLSRSQFVSAILPAVMEGRVLLWAKDASVQEQLAPSLLGGQVSDQPGPFAMAVVNNNAGNKMDTFLHTSVAYQGGECVVGGRRVKVTVELFNDPPSDLPSYVGDRTDRRELFGQSGLGDGSNRVRLAVYLPSGAYLSGSNPGYLYPGTERNHPVAMFGVELAKQQRKSVTVDFTMFGSPAELNAAPLVPAQPMLNAQQISVSRGPTC